MDTNALFKLSYGLYVLTASHGGRDNGCIINTASQVTAVPELLSVCVNKTNLTHDMISESGKLTLSVISEAADFELFRHFGFQSGRDTDKFAGYSAVRRAPNGTLYVTDGVNSYVSMTVDRSVDLGTHTMFIGEVTDAEIIDDTPSATYQYYFDHIKPKSENKSASQTVWRCKICGYEYVGEELPEDYICPLCKHPASDFEKVEF